MVCRVLSGKRRAHYSVPDKLLFPSPVKNFLIAALTIALLASLLLPRKRPPSGPSIDEAGTAKEQPLGPLPPSPVSRYAAVKSAITEAAQTPGLLGAALGFCLIDAAGAVVVDVNAQTALIPASTLKTVTTSTALQRLGPDFRFSTKVLSTAPIVDGVLDGDILIIGEGDPLLALEDIRGWAATLREQGLMEVKGRVIGDGRYFKGSLFDDFWNWGDIGNGYGSAISGLNLEHNRFTVAFAGAENEGDPALVSSILPEVPSVTVISEVITGASDSGDNVMIYGGEKTGRIILRGSVPAGEVTDVRGAVPDPDQFAAWHFHKALQEAGIAVLGPATAATNLEENPLPSTTELLVHQSPPLLELITSIHATSDNHETECLFRKLGLHAQRPPEELIRAHWKNQGLDFIGLRMEDGCGLARADHIRPLDLARLQLLAAKGPHGAAYQASLPVKGSLRWKGGAMSSIRSYTGYITSEGGEVFCFVLMVNHYSDGAAVSGLRQNVIELVSKL